MNKKIVKISKITTITLISILLFISLCALIFILLGNFFSEIQSLNYAYGLLGEIIMPIEFILKGELGLLGNNFAGITIGVTLAIMLIYAFCVKDVVGAYGKNQTRKKFSYISSLIFIAVIFVYFTFNLIIICINFESFATYLDFRITGVFQGLSKSFGVNAVVIKSIIICVLVMLVTMFTFLVFIFNRERENKQTKIIGGLTFYSEEYMEKEQPKNSNLQTIQGKKNVKTEEPKKIPVKKESKELVEKIMQLNALKDEGKLSDVEYTKLRQRAIRKYKG